MATPDSSENLIDRLLFSAKFSRFAAMSKLMTEAAAEIERLRAIVACIDPDNWLHVDPQDALCDDCGDEVFWNDDDQPVLVVACTPSILTLLAPSDPCTEVTPS